MYQSPFFCVHCTDLLCRTEAMYSLTRAGNVLLQVRKIADIMLKDVYGRLANKGIAMTVTEKFKDQLLEQGWNPKYGARPLRRAINAMLEDALSECVLRGDVVEGDSIQVDVNGDGEIVVIGASGVVLSTQPAPTVAAGIA